MPYTEDILLLGSSLCNQVSRCIQESGLNIDSILFKGNISLENIKTKLIKNNRSYKKIFFISGNNLYPSKLHKTQRGSHVCLKPFALQECINIYQCLLEILEPFTDHLIFLEPPPRAIKKIEISDNCLFFDTECKNRFRTVINSLSRNINVGVLTCSTILGFLGRKDLESLLSTDNIHLSTLALQTIVQQVIKN